MNHPNVSVLEKMYREIALGKWSEALSHCAENCTFQIAGKSPLAGKYNREMMLENFIPLQKTLSGGELQLEVHDIMASDRHGLVLTSQKVSRNEKMFEYRSVHVWRIENGLPVAWYEYPRDLYQFDAIWG